MAWMTTAVRKLQSLSKPSQLEQKHPRPLFSDLSAYKAIRQHEKLGQLLKLENPFFRTQDAPRGTSAVIGGKECTNFAVCDYLGLSQHPQVMEASRSAIERFGTCVSASRMVAGQIPIHESLEQELAAFCGTERALAFVSGHAANVSTISTVMGEGDLILLDEFVHNSAVMGARLSRAACLSFRHNNIQLLEKLLQDHRESHRNVLIVVEGCYSTEGDIPDLPKLIALKERFGAWLMADDAHALGVLGAQGRGVAEHYGVEASQIDILMGTLSKTLAACGGFIAGEKTLIEVLKYAAPGFVFSVGLPPAMAAAALAALRVLRDEPQRVARLQRNASLFLREAGLLGLDTQHAAGGAMAPIICGSPQRTVRVTQQLFSRGINASPIIYPGVPMGAGRVRFFVTSEHSPEQIRTALDSTRDVLSQS